MELIPLHEIEDRLKSIPLWGLDGLNLRADFQFTSFQRAMKFVNKVAEIAEQMNHHPNIQINYNKVVLSIYTHSEGGDNFKGYRVCQINKRQNE